MKIGILTFHAQINYGGVLQCFALQEALKKLGHEPIIIDRWFSEDNSALNPHIDKSVKGVIKRLLRRLFGCGENERLKRYKKTNSFIKQYLNLTPYSFCEWKDAPKELQIDAIIVGSDQVWNGIWQKPDVFLLDGAPKLPAISYAASFGMKEIPAGLDEVYREGFKRFLSISVREREGKYIVERLGMKAALVVDPSQLLTSKNWCNSLNIKTNNDLKTINSTQKLVCYFIKEDITKVIPILDKYAMAHKSKVEILIQSYIPLAIPKNFRDVISRIKSILYSSNLVRVRLSADPRDFIELFANADAIISDSYHALMFASIFHKNIRILQPHEDVRAKMFSRITEFASEYINGEIIAKDLNSALLSINKAIYYNDDKLNTERENSLEWLNNRILELNSNNKHNED